MKRDLTTFFNNPLLSDIDIKNPASEAAFKCHKVVLASASDLLNTLFTENDPKLITAFTIPKHIPTKSNLVDDPFPKVMAYIYSNQVFEQIKPDVDENNVTNIYSLAYTLQIPKLKADLEKMIVGTFLNSDTCCRFYIDGIRFESEHLKRTCRDMIVKEFEEIEKSKTGAEFLNNLPFDDFIELIQNAELNVSEEIEIVRVITRYLNHRKTLPPLEEEDPSKDWSHLTEEEKKHREEQKAKSQEEKKKQTDEEEAKMKVEFDKLPDLGKIQHKIDADQEIQIKTANARLEEKRLTKEQKDRLFKAIRYSYLKHEELIDTSLQPDFAPAKDYILQGLSYRLSPYEKANFKDFTINMKPRKNYGPEMEKKLIENFAQSRQTQHDQQIQNEKAQSDLSNNKPQTQGRTLQGSHSNSPTQQHIAQKQQNNQQYPQQHQQVHQLNQQQHQYQQHTHNPQMRQQDQMHQTSSHHHDPYYQQQQDQQYIDNKGRQQIIGQGPNIDRQRQEDFENQLRSQKHHQDMDIGGVMAQSKYTLQNTAPQVLEPHFQKQQQQISQMHSQTLPVNDQKYMRQTSPNTNQQQMSQTGTTHTMQQYNMTGHIMPKAPQKEAYNIHAQTSFSPKKQTMNTYQSTNNQKQNTMYGTQLLAQSQATKSLIEFVYESDFDENGAFYYLGTYGRKKIWKNPHSLGLVHCFASSIGSGKVEDIVGREVVNCRTLNEPFSFFGVDLGEGRFIVPTCYSIRNRNSNTHVLMNWHLEASNDKVNWAILDRRIYLSDNLNYNLEMEEEQKALQKKGATSTWGVDQSIYNEVGTQGFRYFRIVQVGKNSSGSDNLTLSGFELYGRVVHNASWEF